MNKTSLVAVLALSASSLAACASEPSPVVAVPTTTTVAPAAGAAAAPVTGTFAITAQNSKIEWTGAKTSGHHDGSFASFTGSINLTGPIEQGTVSVDIDTPSLTVNDPALGPMADKLAGHLKSPDFFDVAKFPKATFQSTAIKAGGDNGAPYTVSGNLTLHGATKPISFPATIAASKDKVDVTATFDINRKDFGLNYPGKPDDLIKDNVSVKLTIHADRK